MARAGSLAADGSARQPLPDEVAAYVRAQIIAGEVRPGEFLRMEPIATALGISNTPVREGLLTLRSEGFLTQVPRRGFRVEPLTRQDVRDIFWAQAVVAGELASRAAHRADPDLIARLELIEGKYEELIPGEDADALAALGHHFHREINRAAESRRLTDLLGTVARSLPNRFYATIEGHVRATAGDHAQLIVALSRKDGESARLVMEEHVMGGGERLAATLEHLDG